MTTRAKSTKYLRLQRGDGEVSEAFATIAELTNINGPNEKASQLDATSFDSAGMEYIAGLTDGGEISFDCNYVGPDAQQQGLRVDMRAGTVRNFKMLLNDHATNPTTIDFAAIVLAAPGISGGVNAVIKSAGITLKVTGLPTWTYPP